LLLVVLKGTLVPKNLVPCDNKELERGKRKKKDDRNETYLFEGGGRRRRRRRLKGSSAVRLCVKHHHTLHRVLLLFDLIINQSITRRMHPNSVFFSFLILPLTTQTPSLIAHHPPKFRFFLSFLFFWAFSIKPNLFLSYFTL